MIISEEIHEPYNKENGYLKKLKDDIKTLGLELLQLLDDCIKYGKPLWILGL